MGVDKNMVCEECNEYVELDKVPFPNHWEGIKSEEWFNFANYRYQTMKMISFVAKHEGHEIRYIPESSRYESLYFDVRFDDESEKFDIDKRFNEVKGEME